MHLLYRWIISVIALYATVALGKALGLHLYIESGTAGVIPAFIAVLVLGIVNAVLRPILQLLSLPLTCLTFGLFGLVINAFLFWLAGQFVPGFHVRGPISALFGAVMMAILSGLLNSILIPKRERRRKS